MRQLSRHVTALVLLIAAGTLVGADVVCAVSCFDGQDAGRLTLATQPGSCHERPQLTEQSEFRSTGVDDCGEVRFVVPAPTPIDRFSARPASAAIRPHFDDLFSATPSFLSVARRAASPPTRGPALRI